LINNSLEAVKSQQGGWIRVESAMKGGRVEISIVDSGKGIAPDVAAKMFQPFFTTKDVGQGAGLGLSMAQGVFTHQGGELYYDKSSPNTCFKIVMPVAAATMKSA
jgi:C4-dicarboxylate-specific signal transduction histidine kinase